MNLAYQKLHFHVIDYQLYRLAGIPHFLRGPTPPLLQQNCYIAYIGAAQTFGTFCQYPFPNLLSERLTIPGLNLGIGGAGPGLFLQKSYLDRINAARICVVQILSARSVGNSMLVPLAGHNADLIRSNIPGDSPTSAILQYGRLHKELSEPDFRQLIEETRANWVDLSLQLLSEIKVPKVLLWFSHRSPDQIDDYSRLSKVFHGFPQLVNRHMLDKLIPVADIYLEVTSNRGSPQKLMNRFTGLSTGFPKYYDKSVEKEFNDYYPTPQMHVDVTERLEPIIKSMIED